MTKKEKYRLKAWGDPAWQRKLSTTLTVARVDEDIPTNKQRPVRKPWSVAITRDGPAAADGDQVQFLPPGRSLVLSEDEVVALVAYLLEPQTVAWSEEPSPTKPGTYGALLFEEPGMVAFSDAGIVNGEGHWKPSYFKRQEPLPADAPLRTRKVHTLPWPLPKALR